MKWQFKYNGEKLFNAGAYGNIVHSVDELNKTVEYFTFCLYNHNLT